MGYDASKKMRSRTVRAVRIRTTTLNLAITDRTRRRADDSLSLLPAGDSRGFGCSARTAGSTSRTKTRRRARKPWWIILGVLLCLRGDLALDRAHSRSPMRQSRDRWSRHGARPPVAALCQQCQPDEVQRVLGDVDARQTRDGMPHGDGFLLHAVGRGQGDGDGLRLAALTPGPSPGRLGREREHEPMANPKSAPNCSRQRIAIAVDRFGRRQ